MEANLVRLFVGFLALFFLAVSRRGLLVGGVGRVAFLPPGAWKELPLSSKEGLLTLPQPPTLPPNRVLNSARKPLHPCFPNKPP